MAAAAELGDRAELGRALGGLVADGLATLPVAPQECVDVPVAEAVDRLDDLALERQPAHLAVGDHREAGVLLQRHAEVDGAIFDDLEGGPADAPRRQRRLRLEQRGRAQQAADNVGAGP